MADPNPAAVAVLSRLSGECAALSDRLTAMAGELTELQSAFGVAVPAQPATPPPVLPQPAVPQPAMPYPAQPVAAYPAAQYPSRREGWAPPTVAYQPFPSTPSAPKPPRPDRGSGWVGKLLAVAGVGVTLIGVALLLVLAAQAGILRPEIRVIGGAVLAGALVAGAIRFNRRPGGRTGAIALAATGVAAAYLDVIAVCTIYGWIPAPVALLLAFGLAGAGMVLARRWDSQALGLLVLIPLTVLAPIVTDGLDLRLIGFMLIASAASLPFQLAKNWGWIFAARTVAVTLPLLAGLAGVHRTAEHAWLIGGACALAAALALAGALLVLPTVTNRVAIALWTVVGTLPVLVAPAGVGKTAAVLMLFVLAVTLLTIVALAHRLPGVPGPVATIWSALAAAAMMIAAVVLFDGPVRVAVILALALLVALAAERVSSARWISVAVGAFGFLGYLAYVPPEHLVRAHELDGGPATAVLVSSVLLIGCVAVQLLAYARSAAAATAPDGTRADLRPWFVMGGAVVLYAVTAFMVVAGVLIGGTEGGFLAGHVLATICWVIAAAVLLVLALRIRDAGTRNALVTGGMTLTAAAMAKLFLFDLGTLDGIFRVIVFIVVGLILLAMGAGYARTLAQQDSERVDR